jgi:lipoprotein-anchoring transpeptidase ErfK/SrfK
VRRAVLAVAFSACALVGGLAAVVVAGPTAAFVLTTGTTGTTPTTPTGTGPTPPPAPRVMAPGVVVGGVEVGGMTAEAALSVVRTSFFAPLVITYGQRVFRPTPGRLGATAPIRSTVNRALSARPGARVKLPVRVPQAPVRRYVATLAKRFDREAVDARYVLRRQRAVVVPDRPGLAIRRTAAVRAIVAALRANERLPIRLRATVVRARVTRATVGQAVVIQRGSNRLSLFDRGRLVRVFGVATGQSSYPTPLGRFSIVVKWRNPWWYPPNSDWARGAKPIPPGPGNPLGTRWMGLSVAGVGIHGTPDAASIGYSVSHGCIRMRISEAEWLFERVEVGTPVFIVP